MDRNFKQVVRAYVRGAGLHAVLGVIADVATEHAEEAMDRDDTRVAAWWYKQAERLNKLAAKGRPR